MIPTRYKAKISRDLSYPIGAEAIAAALADAPRADVLSLAFSAHAVWPASEFRRLLGARSPYRVLTAGYQPARKPGIGASNHMIEGGSYREKWELWVYPVLREFRHLANGLLRDEGLPAVAAWLGSSRQPGWCGKDQRIELSFDPAEGCLTIAEFSGV